MMKRLNLDEIFNLIIIIFPAVVMLNAKIATNILSPILLIMAILKILKCGLKISFYEKGMGIFILAIFLSFIEAPFEIHNGIKLAFRHLRWLLLPFCIGQFKIEKNQYRYIFISFMIGILGYVFLFTKEAFSFVNSQLFLEKIIRLKEIPLEHRYTGKFDHLPQIALNLGIILEVLIIFFMRYKISKKIKTLLSAGIILSFIMLLSTQSRGMYLAVFLSLMILIFLKNIKIGIAAIICSGAIMGIITLNYPSNPFVIRIKNIFVLDDSNLGRVEVYKEALRIFKENPVNGVGLENFTKADNKEVYKIHEKYYHTHNMPLKLLSELGIIGFISYYFMMGNIIVFSLKIMKKQKKYIILFVSFLTLLIYENFEIIMMSIMSLPFLYMILSIIINDQYFIKIERRLSYEAEK